MKKLILFFVVGALGACGKLPEPTPAVPALHDGCWLR